MCELGVYACVLYVYTVLLLDEATCDLAPTAQTKELTDIRLFGGFIQIVHTQPELLHLADTAAR